MRYLLTVAVILAVAGTALAADNGAEQGRNEVTVLIPLKYLNASVAAQIFGGTVIPASPYYGTGTGYGSYTSGTGIGSQRGYGNYARGSYGSRSYGNRDYGSRSYGGRGYDSYGDYGRGGRYLGF
ncbi:MAG: hypothetical protein AB7Y46_04560 [Armatimonadota bacterium]